MSNQLKECFDRGHQQCVGVFVILSMQRRMVRSGADAKERTGTMAQIMTEILAPAHGFRQFAAATTIEDPLGAAWIIDRGRKNVLYVIRECQVELICKVGAEFQYGGLKGIQIFVLPGPEG